MSKVVDLHVGDTPISGGPSALSVSLPAINWPADWSKTVSVPGNGELTYKGAPFDAPSTVRFAVSRIGNVYTGTTVDPSYQLPYKRGASILAQLNTVATVTDDSDATYRVDLPISAHIVLKAPMSGLLTTDHFMAVLLRAYALLFETGKTDSSRISELMKMSVLPEGV